MKKVIIDKNIVGCLMKSCINTKKSCKRTEFQGIQIEMTDYMKYYVACYDAMVLYVISVLNTLNEEETKGFLSYEKWKTSSDLDEVEIDTEYDYPNWRNLFGWNDIKTIIDVNRVLPVFFTITENLKSSLIKKKIVDKFTDVYYCVHEPLYTYSFFKNIDNIKIVGVSYLKKDTCGGVPFDFQLQMSELKLINK